MFVIWCNPQGTLRQGLSKVLRCGHKCPGLCGEACPAEACVHPDCLRRAASTEARPGTQTLLCSTLLVAAFIWQR